jgi:hypothetical protein
MRQLPGGWACTHCNEFISEGEPVDVVNNAPGGMLDMMIRAGWEKICDGVREAGRQMIDDPSQVAQFLRQAADAIEKRKEFFNRGKQGEKPDAEEGR